MKYDYQSKDKILGMAFGSYHIKGFLLSCGICLLLLHVK